MDALEEDDATIFRLLFNENFSEKWESGIWLPLLELDPSRYRPFCSLACSIVLLMVQSRITKWDGKKLTVQFEVLVIWWIDKTLTESFRTCNMDFHVKAEVKEFFLGLPWLLVCHQQLQFFYP